MKDKTSFRHCVRQRTDRRPLVIQPWKLRHRPPGWLTRESETMKTDSNRPPHGGAVLASGIALALAACAGTPPPNQQLWLATEAVAHAMAAGGAQYAPLEMGLARDKLHRATVAVTIKDHDTARPLAEQAQADAQRAEAKAGSAKARQAAGNDRSGGPQRDRRGETMLSDEAASIDPR